MKGVRAWAAHIRVIGRRRLTFRPPEIALLGKYS